MLKPLTLALTLAASAASVEAAPAGSRPEKKPAVRPAAAVAPMPDADAPIPAGKEVDLTKFLTPERPTVFVFFKPSSVLERDFLDELRHKAKGVRLRTVPLQSGAEAAAQQHEVTQTPAAIVYDRRGRVVTRSSDPAAIVAAVEKAAQVMRIDWVEQGDPRVEEIGKLMGRPVRPGMAPMLPGILRTMSLKPEYLAAINELSQRAHFSDGFIDRRTKEMIATYVSALNKCKY